jgi:hypothetical protein
LPPLPILSCNFRGQACLQTQSEPVPQFARGEGLRGWGAAAKDPFFLWPSHEIVLQAAEGHVLTVLRRLSAGARNDCEPNKQRNQIWLLKSKTHVHVKVP